MNYWNCECGNIVQQAKECLDCGNKNNSKVALRNYQHEAVRSCRAEISKGSRRPLLVLSTGSGKSIIFGEIIRLSLGKLNKCLFIVHRRNLVLQFKKTLEDLFGIDCGVIMSQEDYEPGKSVYVTTIQTYSRRVKLGEEFIFPADIVFIDEAHTSVSNSYENVLNLYDKGIIIGTTATPIRSDGRGLGERFDALIDVVGMQELIDKGYLSDVKYYAPSAPDLSKIKTVLGDYDKKELGKRVDTAKLVGDVVENWMKYASGRKTIIFAVNVKHSIHIKDSFLAVGIAAEHLDAKSSQEKRDAVFERMESGETTIICNVALYQEGMDVPSISCVVMARPTKSLGLWRQCIGRGMRPDEKYEKLIVLDHGGCIEENGLVTDEVCWSLDGKERAKVKKRTKPDKKDSTCRGCHLVFSGSDTCPDCGTVIKNYGREIETADATLEEYGTGKKKKYTMADKRRFYGMLLTWVPRQKNSNHNRVSGAYKGKFGSWPHHSVVNTTGKIEPDEMFLSYMRHTAIAYAKRKNK